jgi:hypothetical protein
LKPLKALECETAPGVVDAGIGSRLAAIACVVALVLASRADEASGAGIRLTGPELVQLLNSGRSREFEHAVVTTTLDLRQLEVVKQSFRCRKCVFTGDVFASDVRFTRSVDLSQSRFKGRVDLHGAAFEATALVGSPSDNADDRTVFEGQVDFTLTTFADFAGFQWVKFENDTDFTLARFRADTVFDDADFNQLVDFGSALFAARASFERGGFRGGDDDSRKCSYDEMVPEAVRFTSAVFRAGANFRQRCFPGVATFDRAEFQDLADFSQATFAGEASFVDSRFSHGGTFFAAHFTAEVESGFAATFERTSASGTLDFDETTFSNDLQLRRLVANAVRFNGAEFNTGPTLGMEQISVSNLQLAVEDVKHLTAEDPERAQKDVLQLIESSARADEHLALANDARYRLQVLASHDDSWPRRIADAVFYRAAAGYFVRPRRPLLVLLGLAAAMVLIREVLVPALKRLRGNPLAGRPASSDVGQWMSRSLRGLGHLLNELVATLALVGRDSSAGERGGGSLARLEVFAYRALLVCALLGLANSNPTLRDMVDALR